MAVSVTAYITGLGGDVEGDVDSTLSRSVSPDRWLASPTPTLFALPKVMVDQI